MENRELTDRKHKAFTVKCKILIYNICKFLGHTQFWAHRFFSCSAEGSGWQWQAGYIGFTLDVWVCCTCISLSVFSSPDDNLSKSGFSPNLVCALILWRSGLGLLMDKVLQFLIEISARHMIVAGYYNNTLPLSCGGQISLSKILFHVFVCIGNKWRDRQVYKRYITVQQYHNSTCLSVFFNMHWSFSLSAAILYKSTFSHDNRLLQDTDNRTSVHTVFTLRIRTPQLLTIYVLKFEPVQFTTRCCV